MAAKPAYQCDHAGLFMGTTEADESPLEPGVWHVPSGATLVAPPPAEDWPADKWPRFNGSGWDYVNRPRPKSAPSAAEKLARFLRENPDVAEMVDAPAQAEIPQEELPS